MTAFCDLSLCLNYVSAQHGRLATISASQSFILVFFHLCLPQFLSSPTYAMSGWSQQGTDVVGATGGCSVAVCRQDWEEGGNN